MLVTMKSIPLLDAELDMGAEADAKRTGRPNGQICSDVNINFPVFKLGAGNESVKYKNKKSLLCTMNISKDCEFASLQKVNHFIMKYLLMARNSLWMNVHIMSSQK